MKRDNWLTSAEISTPESLTFSYFSNYYFNNRVNGLKVKMENQMSEKAYHYVYKITNLINQKIYIGVHSSHTKDDGYMGSGKALKEAYAKESENTFSKEILQYFNTREEAFLEEAKIVTKKFIKRDDTYNLIRGGGGWDMTGKVNVTDSNGNTFQVLREDPRFQSGELVSTNTGKEPGNKGKICYTNGKMNKYFFENEKIIPGFTKGFTQKEFERSIPKYKLVDPNNNTILLKISVKKFCKVNKLSYTTLKKNQGSFVKSVPNRDYMGNRRNTIGWKLCLIK